MTNLKFSSRVIAHRGASGYAPENTLAAFIKAAQLGADWVEFDVMPTQDNIPIIFHDEGLDRITNETGLVVQFPYSYLQTLDAGRWFHEKFSGERILTLADGVRFLTEMHMAMNVELKATVGDEEPFIENILSLLSPYLTQSNNQFLFSSFSIETLYLLRKYNVNCNIGLLIHEWDLDWEKIVKELNCVSVHINNEIITEQVTKKIISMDKSVLCYTVNQPHRAKELFDWGVTAVFTDYPDRIMQLANN